MAAVNLDATYKGKEVEGFLDLHFYRKVGFQLATVFSKLRVTPTGVTLCGAALGILAGHFYYYRDLGLNLLGMVLHVATNALDNADGQLARMTRRGSRTGRALDGLADNLVFASVYVHLCLRFVAGGGSELVWLLALAAGASHSLQSSAGDYFRNAYLYFTAGESRAELDSSTALRTEFDQLRWRDHPWQKFLLRLYLNYTLQQEWLAPNLIELRKSARTPEALEQIAAVYRSSGRSLIRWMNLLATNTRMLLLFGLLLIGQPIWYFFAELTAFNFLLVFLVWQENALWRRLSYALAELR